MVAPGSKALLFGLLSVLPGDVVLPRPCWVSYAAQAAVAGKRVIDVPIAAEAGGVPDPGALREALARRAPAASGILVLTLPDNPTGTLAPRALVEEVCEIAARARAPDRVRRDLPRSRLRARRRLQPCRSGAGARLRDQRAEQGDGPRRLAHRLRAAARRTGRRGCAARADRPRGRGVVEPGGADAAGGRLRPRRAGRGPRARRAQPAAAPARHHGRLPRGRSRPAPSAARRPPPSTSIPISSRRGRAGIETGAQLAEALLERYDIAVLPGEAFGDDPAALRFRMATSLLLGEHGRRALGGSRRRGPRRAPRIRSALDRARRRAARAHRRLSGYRRRPHAPRLPASVDARRLRRRLAPLRRAAPRDRGLEHRRHVLVQVGALAVVVVLLVIVTRRLR